MRTLLAFLCLAASAAFGQTTVSTKTAITGLVNPQQVDSLILVDSSSQPKFETVGLVEVKTEASNVIVRATDANRRILPTTKLSPTTYAVMAQGRIWVRVVCIDFPKNIYTDDELELVIGPPTPPTPPTPPNPPNPPTPPNPDVPVDPFDNIGQRVAQWTAGLTANQAVGAAYLKNARELKGGNPNSTITEQSLKLKAELATIPGYDSSYATFASNLNADLSNRWSAAPMSKGILADYWAAVAAGLGVK